MKFSTVLLSLALTVASTHAAECTLDSVSTVQSKPEFQALQSACGSTVSSAVSSSTTEAAAKKMCEDKTCMNALEAAMKVFPDCTVSGVSFKKTYEDQYATMQSECKKPGATAGSSSAPTAVAGLSVTTAATVAAVVVFAHL